MYIIYFWSISDWFFFLVVVKRDSEPIENYKKVSWLFCLYCFANLIVLCLCCVC